MFLLRGERGRGVERDSERDSEGPRVSTSGLWCLLGDLEGSKRCTSSQGWSGRCTWRRICLCSQGRWTKRAIWVGIDTFFRNFIGELHDLKSYGPCTLCRGLPSELWTASTLAERTGSLSISPQDPLLPGSRKVGEVSQIETFGCLNFRCLWWWKNLHPFFSGLSSYEGLHQLAQCWSSWKNGWSRSYSGRTCFSAAFLVLFLGFHWMRLSLASMWSESLSPPQKIWRLSS